MAEPAGRGPEYPSPLPVLTLLLSSAVLAAVGIILLARSKAPALGAVLLVAGIAGAVAGLVLAIRNVRQARAVARTRQVPKD